MSGGALFAKLPKPPYYAVIFSALRSTGDDRSYGETAMHMVKLAQQQAGYLGIESTRSEDGFGITVSYWDSEAAILAWKQQLDHSEARRQGRERWYQHYELRVAKVERAYGMPAA